MTFLAWLGAALVLLALADMFTTVFHSRAAPGLLSRRLSELGWMAFRQLARATARREPALLSFAGPTLVAMLLLTWSLLVLFGFALVFWPALGTALRASHGPTPTGFWTAVYYSGFNFTTLGLGDIAPNQPWCRLLTVIEALVGFSVLTSAVSFILSIYGALVRRNTLARLLHYQSGATGAAVELLIGLGPQGRFEGANQQISSIAQQLFGLVELHHTYPSLHYFRFRPPQFAMARILLLSMDIPSLGFAALDERRHAALVHSSGMRGLWCGGMEALRELSAEFLPRRDLVRRYDPTEKDFEQWRRHYRRAMERLRDSGIAEVDDADAGFRRYAELRRQWHPYVRAFADWMAYPWEQIAPSEPPRGEKPRELEE